MKLGEGERGAFEHEALRFVIDVNIVVQYVSKFFFSTPDTPWLIRHEFLNLDHSYQMLIDVVVFLRIA